MSIPENLPWHTEQWQALGTALATDRLHHALLLEGAPGLGKLAFARRAAAALLCESESPATQRPCGTCRSCRLVAAASHPDALVLAPEEDRSVINVDQVRARIAELTLTPHYAARRVITVEPADALNRHAANTLLKTLEEPPGGASFLLVTARPAALPATVRSRCVRLRFHPPPRAQGARWLAPRVEDSGLDAAELIDWGAGAPLAALAASESGAMAQCAAMADEIADIIEGRTDPVIAASGWRGHGLAQVLDWQLRIVAQAMRVRSGAAGSTRARSMQAIGATLDLRALDRVCEELLELRSALERQLNPSEQLALEGVAASWRDAARQTA